MLTIDFIQQLCSIGAEVLTQTLTHNFPDLVAKPKRLALPNFPIATWVNIEKDYYFSTPDVCIEIGEMYGVNTNNLGSEISDYQSKRSKQV